MKALPIKLFLIFFCVFLFSFGAGRLSLEYKGDENFYFRSAEDMLERGDLITPQYLGKNRFEKPILFYWLVAASFKILGVGWFSARFVSAAMGALTVFLVFLITDSFRGDRLTAVFASVFLATTPLFYRYSRLALPEVTMVFFMTLSLYLFARFYRTGEGGLYILLSISLALAFLTKGFSGVLIPVFIIAIFTFVKKRQILSARQWLVGLVFFSILVSPWFYLMYRLHGSDYISHVWTREILQRLGAGGSGSYALSLITNAYYYTAGLITRFFPYSLFLPAAVLKSGLSIRSGRNQKELEDLHLISLIWIGVAFIFFTLVGEARIHYLLALAPPVAIITASLFSNVAKGRVSEYTSLFRIPYVITLAGISVFAVLFSLSEYISGTGVPPAWKIIFIVVPLTMFAGYNKRKSLLTALVVPATLSFFYIMTVFAQPLGLFTNKMECAARAIKTEYRHGDAIIVGSHGIIPEELQVYFEVPILVTKARYAKNGEPDEGSRRALNAALSPEGRKFCVIKRKDYEAVMPLDIKERFRIIKSYYVWKRRITLDDIKARLGRANRKGPLRDIVQNEIYVITNSEEGGRIL